MTRPVVQPLRLTAEPYSPPIARPCTARRMARMMGAASPMLLKVGRQPMAHVGMAMVRMLLISAVLREEVSAMWPKITCRHHNAFIIRRTTWASLKIVRERSGSPSRTRRRPEKGVLTAPIGLVTNPTANTPQYDILCMHVIIRSHVFRNRIGHTVMNVAWLTSCMHRHANNVDKVGGHGPATQD